MQSTDAALSPKELEDKRRREFMLDHSDAVKQLTACAIVGEAYDFTLFEPISYALATSVTPNPPKDLLRLTHPAVYESANAVDELRQRIADLRAELAKLEEQLQTKETALKTSLPGVARDCFRAVQEKMAGGFFVDNPSINQETAKLPVLFCHHFSPEASSHMARSLCGCRAEWIGKIDGRTQSNYVYTAAVPAHCVTEVCAVHYHVFGITQRRLCALFCELLREKGVASTDHLCQDK